jgi:hypothetical protein
MARNEWVLHLGMSLLGMVFVIESVQLGLRGVHRPGAGFLPFFVGIGLSMLGIFSLVKNLLDNRRDPNKEGNKLFGRSALSVVVLIVVMYAYVVVLPWLGYLLSTFMLLIYLFKAGGFRKWAYTLIAALVTVSISYWLFGFLLMIRFPKGLLGF